MTARADLNGVNVLLVEHGPITSKRSPCTSAGWGHPPGGAQCTREALDAYAALVPDVIVSDLHDAGRHGLGPMRRLRLKGVNVPAIAVSAHHSTEERSASKLADFDLHLVNPITTNEFSDAICQVLS